MSSSDIWPLPEEALEEKFLAASGPGGQNVNKVATACQLRCDVFKLGLAPPVYARLKELAGSRMTEEGVLVIDARRFRTQAQNREDARERLADLIRQAAVRPKRRRRTRPTAASRERRIHSKRRRSEVRRGRGKYSGED